VNIFSLGLVSGFRDSLGRKPLENRGTVLQSKWLLVTIPIAQRMEQPIRNMLLDVEAIGLPSIINGLATHHCTSFPIIVGRSRQNQSKKSGADGPNERTKPATLTSSSNVGHHHLTPEQLDD
jgi:hypothetical protein